MINVILKRETMHFYISEISCLQIEVNTKLYLIIALLLSVLLCIIPEMGACLIV